MKKIIIAAILLFGCEEQKTTQVIDLELQKVVLPGRNYHVKQLGEYNFDGAYLLTLDSSEYIVIRYGQGLTMYKHK